MPLSRLNDQSALASRSRVECVREGLEGPDRAIWIRAAKARIEELERHGALFGLEAFEIREIADLRALLREMAQISGNQH
jgi:hypothetical protein